MAQRTGLDRFFLSTRFSHVGQCNPKLPDCPGLRCSFLSLGESKGTGQASGLFVSAPVATGPTPTPSHLCPTWKGCSANDRCTSPLVVLPLGCMGHCHGISLAPAVKPYRQCWRCFVVSCATEMWTVCLYYLR